MCVSFSLSDEINCASGPCGVNAECVDISIGVYLCYCTTGYMLVDDHFCFGVFFSIIQQYVHYMHQWELTSSKLSRDHWLV